MSESESGLPPTSLCDCESMGGRFGGHREECPWQVALQAQAAVEMEYESYRDRRDRDYLAHQAHQAGLLGKDQETEVLNREDELAEPETWNTVVHEVVVKFRWSQVSRYGESAMESIEMVDADPIGTSFDAFLEPHFDSDSFEVVSKKHTVTYDDEVPSAVPMSTKAGT